MITTCYEIDDALRLRPLASEKAAQACQRAEARIWIDLQGAQPDEVEAWLDKLGVSDLSRKLCVEARDRSGFYPLKQEIILVLPVLRATNEPQPEVDCLAALCRENLLLTIHNLPVANLPELAMLEKSDSWLPERSIAGLVSAMLIRLSLEGLGRTTKLRNSILALEGRMDREPDSVKADEIVDLRSDLLSLGAAVSDQLPPVQALSKIDRPFFMLTGARDYLNCAMVNLQAADASLEWLDQRLGSLRSGFDMRAQDKTNRRLNMLTILSAIFMPITLLAGIWGMNFESMPELGVPYAYPFALGVMTLVGLGMYHFFRKTGWLD